MEEIKNEYVFIAKWSNYGSVPDTKIIHCVEGETSLPEILQSFEDFLRGSGFSFDGSIQVVENDE